MKDAEIFIFYLVFKKLINYEIEVDRWWMSEDHKQKE
jgi:hypothetical protein